jgi:hypothetical protein
MQSAACVGLGALLGLVAAKSEMNPSSRADVAERPVSQVAAGPKVTDRGVGQSACFSEGSARNGLLAQADPKDTAAQAQLTVSLKKPNIVVIMCDDVVPASAIVGQFLETFKEYPPSQAGGSFGIEKALQMLEAGSRGGGK